MKKNTQEKKLKTNLTLEEALNQAFDELWAMGNIRPSLASSFGFTYNTVVISIEGLTREKMGLEYYTFVGKEWTVLCEIGRAKRDKLFNTKLYRVMNEI